VATVRFVGFIDLSCRLDAGRAEDVQYLIFRGDFLRARGCTVSPGMECLPFGMGTWGRAAPAAVLIAIFVAAVRMVGRVRCRIPQAGGAREDKHLLGMVGW